jgi:hypothetical protein
MTEQWLTHLYLWLELPHEEKLVLLTQEYLNAQLMDSPAPLYGRDDLIEGILTTTSEENPLIPQFEQLIITRSDDARRKIHSISKANEPIPEIVTRGMQAYLNQVAAKPTWRRIVEGHILAERVNMEQAINRVQRSFIRVKILCDK